MIPAVTIDITNGDIVNPAYDISEEIAQNGPDGLGLSPDLEVLIKHEPFERPTVDFRLFSVDPTEAVVDSPHPTYPLFRQYALTYTTPKRSKDFRKARTKDKERDELNKEWPQEDQVKHIAVLLAALDRKVDGLVLTDAEEESRVAIHAIAANVALNDANRKSKDADIDNDEDPNLDSGWASNSR